MRPILVIVFLAALQTKPATQPSPQPEEFEKSLQAIDARAGAIKDLTADFVQEKRSPLLRRPLISRGTVRAKGSLALWESREPEPTRMRIDPQSLQLYYPNQKVIEEYPIRGQLGMMAASPLPRLDAVRKSFALKLDDGAGLPAPRSDSHGVCAVRMQPIDTELAQYVNYARVLLDADRGVMLAFELVDPDGEVTLIQFTNIRIDPGLGDEDLKLGAPPGTKVVHPAEGAGVMPHEQQR